MPLDALPGLISYAEEREAIDATRWLWLAQYLTAQWRGAEPIGAEEFFAAVTDKEKTREARPERSAEEIEREYAAVVAADKRKGVTGGGEPI